jgi:membrane dipeptidase
LRIPLVHATLDRPRAVNRPALHDANLPRGPRRPRRRALVRQAASVTDKPLVLSHTSLAAASRPHSRLIAPDHARAIAGTGGVIGIWPPASIFPDLAALAVGIARMADVVGVEHVALGSDMNGLVGPSTFASYRDLPALADALLQHGFNAGDVQRILGGNYARVFRASLGDGAVPSQVASSGGAA